MNLDIEDITEILRDAGTVYFGTGVAEDSRTAAKKAVKMCGDINRAKRVLINVTAGTEIVLAELSEASYVAERAADPEAQVIWGHVIDEGMSDSVRVSVFAAIFD